MRKLKEYFKGDATLWASIFLISLASFLPVYSASSNLQYVVGQGSVLGHFAKHAGFIIIGLGIVFIFQKIDYKYIGGFSKLLLPLVIFLLILTLIQGQNIDGANAARWLKLPGVPFAFQTSVFASLILMIYVARYLDRNKNKIITLNNSFLPVLLPIFLVVGLIFPANGSTAIIIFLMVLALLFIGGYPIKIILGIVGTGILIVAIFITIILKYPELFPSNRVYTWKSRIENFFGNDKNESYQVQQAKAAIIQGGIIPRGPGKSAFKQSLPQSSSDFIFAIIVEEYGYAGVAICFFLYLLILWRIIVIATRIESIFGTLLVVGVGLPIIFQAFSNMAVAVNLIPVTGQPLPILSYGGTSMWVTYMALGIIISVSRDIKPKDVPHNENNIKDKTNYEIA
ncbi:FtsW/RodA/SpoVE family cell cycle protein [Apibacter adventoris]|uniref:FtsW/RodA/SpoVE family cell cycle protein n=1 Tax=Apibacter adventoris TaxID=1679466 RepID=UPI000CF61668|nr:FtsW/RodA/SpoVE family cell cycle protein [Apibacter adventoris]PQL95764.1 cell division protein FtsW [Apibacter adventoris]